VLGSEECTAPIRSWRTSSGACLDPAAAFLVERGLKTLPLRVEAQSRNALALARFLEAHPAVRRVHYCGLPSHPSHARAKRLLDGCGGLVSFEHAGGDRAALEMIRRLSVFTEASSLGGVESLATRPIDLSHDELDAEERRAAGIGPGLVRLAVGVEDESDLLADLDRALAP
ncbi:MAG TPA: hypothetical protein ENJ09_04865, partial [Planctomycetes bacterium]|nr:hypothetical protein [Planctomycetota bacterium]